MDKKIFIAEFVGTFTLIFIGAGAGAIGAGGLVGVALAHGFVIVGAAYAFGTISGAHVNPAVTLAMVAAKELELKSAVTYWVAQFLGGAVGGWVLFFVLGGAESGLGKTVLAEGVNPLQGIVVELVLTFFLVNAIFQTAVKGRGGDFAGLAIGLTLTFSILMGGPLTGASLNPARTFGPALFTGLGQFWIYLLGPGLGGLLAAWLNKVLD